MGIDNRGGNALLQRLLNITDVDYRKKDPCPWCGRMRSKNKGWTREHITPTSQGGRNGWENVVYAHGTCNRWRGHTGVLWWLWALRRTSPNGNGSSAREQLACEYRRIALGTMDDAQRAEWKAETLRRKTQAGRDRRLARDREKPL